MLVIGIAGACRTDELCNMLIEHVDVRDDIIIITIPTSKNGSSRKFVVIEPLWIRVVKRYFKTRPIPDLPRMFLGFRGGKCTRQNMGHNTISKMPQTIASFLKLKNCASYTGHTFRRTSATILAENGGDILTLKRHGGWKSSGVAEGYIEQSIADKKRIAEMVQSDGYLQPSTSTTTASATITRPSISTSPIPSTSFRPPSPSIPPLPVSAENKVINIRELPVGNNIDVANTGLNTGSVVINSMMLHNCNVYLK